MDKKFNGYVRFKDYCKFVKKWHKGKAYDNDWFSDSSLSLSDFFSDNDSDRERWHQMDPERTCHVHIDVCARQICERRGVEPTEENINIMIVICQE